MANEKEYRIAKLWGLTFVEIRYKGEEWHNWLFLASETPKKGWIYVPEVNMYRRNVSYG